MGKQNDQAFIDTLTLPEKAALVSGKDAWYTATLDRVGLKRLMMTDGPSGLRKQNTNAAVTGINDSVTAVSFPSSALTASSFNRTALNALGHHLGKAARAEKIGVLLGPGINLKRSPLAGRNFEYFSEDPYLAGEMASAYVDGVQAEGVGVSVKHFAANNRENQRFTSSSNMDERTLRELYLAAFEKVVKHSHPATLMCSYNAINGTLNSQNKHLLTDILRDEWGFQGLVMSDWGAVADHTAAIQAGLDLEMPGKGPASTQEIIDAVNAGKLSEHDLNRSVRRVLTLVATYRPDNETVEQYDLDEQHDFARKLAAESMVLLKNNGVLPLKPNQSLAVIGELAAHPRYQGGGSSHVNAYKVVTPLQAIQTAVPDAVYEAGYQLNNEAADADRLQRAVAVAKQADHVVIFAGYPASRESEGFDKTSLSLPDNQNELIDAVTAVNDNVTVVLQNGSVVLMPWADHVQGILETYLAGEAVGEATWDVLSGAVNPAGRLAETFPKRLADTPSYLTFNADPEQENYREGLFMGYRYYDKKQQPVAFPFGFGLSYTTFKVDDLKLTVGTDSVTATLSVTNTGRVAGTETVQVYVSNQTSRIEKPVKALANFAQVTLAPGETQTVTLTLNQRAFSWYNPAIKDWQVDNGDYAILVGASSQDIRLQATATLDWPQAAKPQVTLNSYIGDVLGLPEAQAALKESGLTDVFAPLASGETTDQQMLLNIPLRSANMVGATQEQLDQFLSLMAN